MIVALDAAYLGEVGCAAAIVFTDWTDPHASAIHTACLSPIATYEAGAFYKRELPVLQAVLKRLAKPPDTVVIDGYVWLDSGQAGLGAHLHQALDTATAVIGVAKSPFRNDTWSTRVTRGVSDNPLFITAAGIDQDQAAAAISSMAGAHRIPTLLKLADQTARQAAKQAAPAPRRD